MQNIKKLKKILPKITSLINNNFWNMCEYKNIFKYLLTYLVTYIY